VDDALLMLSLEALFWFFFVIGVACWIVVLVKLLVGDENETVAGSGNERRDRSPRRASHPSMRV
jgi:hypothetical protein